MRAMSLAQVRRSAAVLGFTTLLCTAACQPTPEKIATWKGTQKGPQKLRDVITDDGGDPRLRALSVAALVEIGMGADAVHDLSTGSPGTKAAVVHELIAPLVALLGESATRTGATTPVQRAAKDALFQVRSDAAAADRSALDAILIKWATADLAARASAGGESTEKILRAIGPAAGPALVPLVKNGPDLIFASKLLGELGEPGVKQQASAQLIALAKAGHGGLGNVPEPILQSLGFVGGVESTAFLLELGGKSGGDTRTKALYALAQGHLSPGDAKALAGAIAIAADTHAPGNVREAAFQVTEKLGPAAVGGLVGLFTDRDATVRYRAIEAALKAGGAAAIERVLPALPEDKPWKSEDLDSYVVHDLTLLGKEALAPILLATKRPPALGQIAAIRALARMGGPTQAGVLASLAADRGAPRSLLPATTVGAEAARAKVEIEKRH